MLQTRPARQTVPLYGAKRAGFRYNRRDIQIDERFEAVTEQDARILVQAKLARHPTPAEVARARAPRDVVTAAPGDDRSRIVTRDAGIPAAEVTVITPKHVASDEAPPELRATEDLEPPPNVKKKTPAKKRKPASVGDPPANS